MTISDSLAVVLIRFPFTDLTSAKKRPAVIVSPWQYSERYGDVVIIPLTSVNQNDDSLRLAQWKDAGLLKETWVKPLLATVSKSLITRQLGRLHERDMRCVRSSLKQMLSIAPESRASG